MRKEALIATATAAAVTAALLTLTACSSEKTATAEKPEVKAAGGEFVPGKTGEAAEKDTSKAVFKGPGAFAPKDKEVEGIALVQGPDYYVKDKLYEIMDGASDGYIGFGFKEMAKVVYAPPGGDQDKEINVQVFEFDGSKGALGKFADERSGCTKADTFDANWCLRASDLLLWKGPYMVKVLTYDDSPEGEASIVKVAKAIDAKITVKPELPAYLGKFPIEKRVKGGEGWVKRDAYGYSGLKEIFTVKYRPDGEAYADPETSVTLFGVEKASADEAKKLYESIKAQVEKDPGIKGKGGAKKVTDAGESAIQYTDTTGTHTLLLKGKHVAGGREFQDEATATAMTRALAGGL